MPILKGLKEIATYMRWKSPSTVWRNHYRQRIPFPITPLLTGRGQSISWVADTELITLWIQRMGDPKFDSRKGRVLRARERKRAEQTENDTGKRLGGSRG
jgi:hypothetical protein